MFAASGVGILQLLQLRYHRFDSLQFELQSEKVVIYFTQVASFSPYWLWSDPLLPRHI